MKHNRLYRLLSAVTVLSLLLSLTVVPATAADTGFEGLVTEEMDGVTISFTSDSTYGWNRDSEVTNRAAWSSNNKGKDSTTAVLTATVVVPDGKACTLSFDCSDGFLTDQLTVDLNGVTQYTHGMSSIQYVNQLNWETVSLDLSSGSHTITWNAVKDNSNPEGYESYFLDKAYLANIKITPVITTEDYTVTYNSAQGSVFYQIDEGEKVPVASGTTFKIEKADMPNLKLIAEPINNMAVSDWTRPDGTYFTEAQIDAHVSGAYKVTFIKALVPLPSTMTISYKGVDGQTISVDFSKENQVIEQPLDQSRDYALNISGFPSEADIKLTIDNVLLTENKSWIGDISNRNENRTLELTASMEGRDTITRTVQIITTCPLDALRTDDSNITFDTSDVPGIYPWRYDLDNSTPTLPVFRSGNEADAASDADITVTVTEPGVLLFDYLLSADVESYLAYRVGSRPNISMTGGLQCDHQFTGTSDLGWQPWSISISQEDITAKGKNDTLTIYFVFHTSPGETVGNFANLSNFRYATGSFDLSLSSIGADSTLVSGMAGSIELSGGTQAVSIPAGSNVRVTAADDKQNGLSFYGWIDEAGKLLSVENPYSFPMSGNLTVRAQYYPTDSKTARIGASWYDSLDKALSAANAGDTVALLKDVTLPAGETTIPRGVTLLLPYSATDTTGFYEQKTGSSTRYAGDDKLFRSLTVPSDATLRIEGKAIVGSILSYPGLYYNGHTSSWHAQINCNGAIEVASGGSLDSYGYIKGGGSVTAEDGASVCQPFVVADFVGGTNTSDLYGHKQAPFTRYTINNIQTYFTLHSNATLAVRATLYAGSKYNSTTAVIAGPQGTGGIIELSPGAVLTAYYDGVKSVSDRVDGNNLNDDIGRTHLTISGGASFGPMTLTIPGLITVNTADVDFPIPYNYDITLKNGEYDLTVPYKLMPGASLTVAQDAHAIVSKSLVIYDGLTDSPKSGKYYPGSALLKSSGFPQTADFFVDGSLTVKPGAAFVGYAQTNYAGTDTATAPVISLEEGAILSRIVEQGSTGGYVDNLTTRTLSGWLHSGMEAAAMEAGKRYIALNNTAWTLDSYTYTKATAATSHTVTISEPMAGTWAACGTLSFVTGENTTKINCAVGSTFPVSKFPAIPQKTGYTATWNVTADITVAGDQTITATYTPNSYTVHFDANGGEGTMDSQAFIYDVEQALTANAFKKAGYSFAGWSKTENGAVEYTDGASVSNLTAEQGGTVPLYAVWTEKAAAGLVFVNTEITKGYGDAPFTNELTKATDATVTYTSSNENVATVDADGRATIVGLGDTTITATAVETGTHAAGSASYSLHVGKGTQSAPTGLTAQSCAAPGDTGSISGLTAAMEYKRSDSTGDYIPCPDGGSLTKLAAGTYLIRYAATELYEPGADATLVIAPYIEAEISRVTADNGSVTAVLKDAPTDIPAKENWTLVYHLSDSVSAYPLDVTAYQYDAGTRTAQFSFSPIPRAPQAQEVTVSVSISGSTQECSFTVDRQTTYTVQFDGNGGEGEMAEQSFYYDVVQRLSNNTYSLRNSVFAGWSTSRGGSVVYQDNAPVSRLEAIDGGIITLYAVWTNKALSGLTFQSREITVRYGEAAQANPLSKDTSAAAVYTSGNPAVATVDPDSGAITITGVGSAVITATVAETDGYASGAASYTLQVDKGLQGKPTGLTGHDSVDADSAGSITGVTAAMEYKAPGSDRYFPCTGTVLNGLSAGEYLIRYAETALYEAGEPVTVTIRKTTTGGGGGGGGGGGSAVEEPAPTAPPATSGSSTVLEPESIVENGKASSTLDADTADKLVEQAAKSGSTEIVVKPAINTDDAGKVTQAVVELPASAVAGMAEKTDAVLKVETPVASITLPNESLASLAGTAGGSVAISAARQADGAVKVELRSGGKAVDRLDGGLTVTLPVEDAAPGTVAMLVKADGTTEVIKKSALLDGGLVVPLEGSATVKLVDNSKAFSDVAPDDWYGGAVAFASAHELFSGTGDGSFDPGRSMDRGMLVTVLHRLENTPQGGSALFDDVAADAYYADAVAWAAENGIVTGNGSGFDPQGSVSREQLAVMLYRYASREGAGATGSLDGFRDADAVSPWAADAMAWAVGAGLIQGDPSAGLNPGGSATRAEVAAILQRFITAAAQNQL